MDRKMWKDVRNEAKELRLPRMPEPVFGFDHDPAAMRLCERSASEAGVSGDIQFRIQEISELKSNREYGVIVCNPPYGERMGDPKEVEAVYRELGRVCESLHMGSVCDHFESVVRKALRSPGASPPKTLQWSTGVPVLSVSRASSATRET